MEWGEWLSVPIYVLQLVALWGYAFWRRIGTPPWWKLVLAATIVLEAWFAYQMAADPQLAFAYGDWPVMGAVVAVYVFEVPIWFALFLYAFRCRQLWLSPR